MDINQLTPRERMALAMLQAKRLIASRRAEAPEGFDPKMSWVMAAVTVGTAVYGGVQANKAKKDAKNQAAAAAQNNQLAAWNPPDRPVFNPIDVANMLKASIKGDQEAYQRSDADFKARHGKTVEAESLFEDQVLKDQRGEHELSPQIQSELMRAGLGGALEAFGDTPGTLTPGSAGEASVARNLGLGVMQFQDRNRANRMQSLKMAEDIFPRREIGMGGEAIVSANMANVQGENAHNQATFGDQMQAYGNNYQIGSQNQATNQQAANAAAQAEAQANAAQTQAVTSALTGVAKSYGTSQAGANQGSSTMAALPPGQVSGYTYYPSVGYVRN